MSVPPGVVDEAQTYAAEPPFASDLADDSAAAPDDPATAPDEDSDPEGLTLSARLMTATNALGGTFGLGIDQYELPRASISKLARTDIPDSVQLRKDTITALVKSSSVFVSYLSTSLH